MSEDRYHFNTPPSGFCLHQGNASLPKETWATKTTSGGRKFDPVRIGSISHQKTSLKVAVLMRFSSMKFDLKAHESVPLHF